MDCGLVPLFSWQLMCFTQRYRSLLLCFPYALMGKENEYEVCTYAIGYIRNRGADASTHPCCTLNNGGTRTLTYQVLYYSGRASKVKCACHVQQTGTNSKPLQRIAHSVWRQRHTVLCACCTLSYQTPWWYVHRVKNGVVHAARIRRTNAVCDCEPPGGDGKMTAHWSFRAVGGVQNLPTMRVSAAVIGVAKTAAIGRRVSRESVKDSGCSTVTHSTAPPDLYCDTF